MSDQSRRPLRFQARLAAAAAVMFVFCFGSMVGGAPAQQSGPEAAVSRGGQDIIDLQPFRQSGAIAIKGPRGQDGRATLIQLNPNVNGWLVLRLSWRGGTATEEYHLENASPRTQKLLLEEQNPDGLVIVEGNRKTPCELWGIESKESLKAARASRAAYAPLCGGKLYLLNSVKGHRTRIESVTDFLRDQVPAGDKIVSTVRDNFYNDAYREKAETVEEPEPAMPGPIRRKLAAPPDETRAKPDRTEPEPARIDPDQAHRLVMSPHLGIKLQEASPRGLAPGNWYAAKDHRGVYVSLMAPGMVARDILRSYRNTVSALDKAESEALVYLVAFDLDQFDVKFSLGTEHPRVDWSDRPPDRMKDPSLPGPDGIGTIAPLVSTGLVSPKDAGRTVAAFTGGFKRAHGAFKWGRLSLQNHGSHYGFIEHGVVFSRLQPGLSTLYVLRNGRLNLKTWTAQDDDLLPEINYARQNGVPIIIEFDARTRMSVPGPLVSRWSEGNWAGSEDKKLRTMRAGAALQEVDGKRFLLYADFTSATPSAMARVFQAYGCSYAMPLDMNALEHTYLALYNRQGSNLVVQYLIQGMSAVDKSAKGQSAPRFLGYPDNRDFFYVLRKEPQ
ncbi:MAG TPA: hypothetical protein VFG28_05025 [Syntrophales bacterium]|nr:hypothetical protein [Syntrophales bacterium]